MRNVDPGTFMVRLAESHQGYALSMTLFDGKVQHFKIWQEADGKYKVFLAHV